MRSTHLKATQALAQLLAELHIYFRIAHYVFAKLLSHETALREVSLPLHTLFFCNPGARCLSAVCGFAQGLGSVDGCV